MCQDRKVRAWLNPKKLQGLYWTYDQTLEVFVHLFPNKFKQDVLLFLKQLCIWVVADPSKALEAWNTYPLVFGP